MAKITVRLHGQDIANLKLESGSEYIAGRAQEAQIRLENQRGISRQHLKFYEREGYWVCESLSKFVLLQKGSESVSVLELTENCVFSVPPYEFHFDLQAPETAAEVNPAEAPAESDNIPAFYQPQIAQPSMDSDSPADSADNTNFRANNDATIAGGATLIPYLRISHPNTADDEVLKLEGQIWVAGRDHGCEISIDSPHISRRHFEMVRTKEGFFVTDLGSSNGTKLNGQKLPPHEPTRVESGDEIRIMNISMIFEIRDAQFSHRVDNLPVATFDPMLVMPHQPPWPMPHEMMALPPGPSSEMPEHWTQIRPHHLKQVDWKKNKVRLALIVLVPLMLVMALTEPEKQDGKGGRNPSQDGQSVTYEKLSKEQQGVVKDTFKLATSLYVQGKYALCLTELAKLHGLIPQYDNSKELQSYCEQGLELVRRQEDLDRKESERQRIEQQISAIVEACKAKLTVDSTVDDTRLCLADAMVLAPEHALVIELLHTAQMREEERKFMIDQKRKEEERAAAGEKHFAKAMSIYRDGRLAASLSELEKFLDTEYPRDSARKAEARRQLAAIKKELKTKVDFHLDQCRSLGEKSRFREAWESCDQALQEEPKNKEARALRESMHGKLRKEMKSIYEDSVLEESLGNVDSAKEKWRKILSENLPFDEYSKKAKLKLEKYEGL